MKEPAKLFLLNDPFNNSEPKSHPSELTTNACPCCKPFFSDSLKEVYLNSSDNNVLDIRQTAPGIAKTEPLAALLDRSEKFEFNF